MVATSGHTTAQRTAMQATYTAASNAKTALPAGANGLSAYHQTLMNDLQLVVTKEGGAKLT